METIKVNENSSQIVTANEEDFTLKNTVSGICNALTVRESLKVYGISASIYDAEHLTPTIKNHSTLEKTRLNKVQAVFSILIDSAYKDFALLTENGELFAFEPTNMKAFNYGFLEIGPYFVSKPSKVKTKDASKPKKVFAEVGFDEFFQNYGAYKLTSEETRALVSNREKNAEIERELFENGKVACEIRSTSTKGAYKKVPSINKY